MESDQYSYWVFIEYPDDFRRSMHPNLFALEQRHDERDSVLNHRYLDCLLNCLFRRRSKKTLKLGVTGLSERNSPAPLKGPVTQKMFSIDDVLMV